MQRREFLKLAGMSCAAYSFSPWLSGAEKSQGPFRFGLITDVHQDVMHDASERVSLFGQDMTAQKAGFIAQLGDFCWPQEQNLPFMKAWNDSFAGPRKHVIGNHDTDGGFKKNDVLKFWGLDHPYYSWDQDGLHFIVLDGNEPGGKAKGYKRFVSPQQLQWLKQDLASHPLPSIVFIHQPIDGSTDIGIENHAEVRAVLEAAKRPDGARQVIASFCGHNHDDSAIEIAGIHHIRINSSSYAWLGGEYRHHSYSEEIHKSHKWLEYVAPYKAPLWALVEVDLARGLLLVKGRKTEWVGKDPWTLGVPKTKMDPKIFGPQISDRHLDLR
jgi:3',5'-cyclic-AMP phosphodiesterase